MPMYSWQEMIDAYVLMVKIVELANDRLDDMYEQANDNETMTWFEKRAATQFARFGTHRWQPIGQSKSTVGRGESTMPDLPASKITAYVAGSLSSQRARHAMRVKRLS